MATIGFEMHFEMRLSCLNENFALERFYDYENGKIKYR